MIGKILSLLFGAFTSGHGATRAASAGAGLTMWAGALGAVAWFFGPGKEWEVTLNALELSAVLMAGGFGALLTLRLPPPDNS